MELKKGDLININVSNESESLLDKCTFYVRICDNEQSKEVAKENLVLKLIKEK